jgi:hypothetical protein
MDRGRLQVSPADRENPPKKEHDDRWCVVVWLGLTLVIATLVPNLQASDRACRSLQLKTDFSHFDSSGYGAAGRVECDDEYSNPYPGEFTARLWFST